MGLLEIEIVQDAPIGGTVAIVSGDDAVIERALKHIKALDVGVEVLKEGKEEKEGGR